MKKITILLLVCIVLSISSCGSSKDTLVVASGDYPGLSSMAPGTFDSSIVYEYHHYGLYRYSDLYCHVSIRDDQLYISNKGHWREIDMVPLECAYIIGVNLGSIPGWVRYHPMFPEVQGDADGRLISDMKCRGLVRASSMHGYVLVGEFMREGSPVGDPHGQIIEIIGNDECEYTWQVVSEFEECPLAHYYHKEQEKLYFITNQSVKVLDAENQLETLIDSSLIKDLCHINSMVYFKDRLYCGCPFGIYCYDLQTGEEIWYPMDYEPYVKK